MAFRAPGADEYTDSKFLPLAGDEYRVSVNSYEIKTGTDVYHAQYNPKSEPRVWFYLSPLAIEGDDEAEIVDVDDNPAPDDARFVFFFDPTRLGLKPVVAKSRKFLASALGIPVEQPVDAESLDALAKSLVGRELVASVEVKTRGNGKQVNVITDTRPVRRRVRGKREQKDLVAEAERIFNEPEEDEF